MFRCWSKQFITHLNRGDGEGEGRQLEVMGKTSHFLVIKVVFCGYSILSSGEKLCFGNEKTFFGTKVVFWGRKCSNLGRKVGFWGENVLFWEEKWYFVGDVIFWGRKWYFGEKMASILEKSHTLGRNHLILGEKMSYLGDKSGILR